MSSLEPDRATLEQWVHVFAGAGLSSIDALATTPACGPLGHEADAIADALHISIADDPFAGGPEELARRITAAAAASLTTTSPGYLAYVPGGGLPSAAIAEMLAAMLNRYTGLAAAAPALCRLEADVIAWLAAELGLPGSARGLLTSGGSLANLAAIVAARHHLLGDDGDLRRATMYGSSQIHHSVAKAARVAGVPLANLREVAVDATWRLAPDGLAAAIARDRAAGMRPFLVVSAAGTTNTGAVDPLAAIADLCADEGLWHHVDGAYGGAFALCAPGRQILAGLERADSITLDPHKGLFLPYGTGCLLVRDGERLRAAHHVEANYLQDLGHGGLPSPTEYGPELSRDFRGLRLWLPLMLHGAGAFRRALEEKLQLASELHDALAKLAAAGAPIEIVAPPQLSALAWRLRPHPGDDAATENRRNAQWLAATNARGRVHLSSTTLDTLAGPRFTLRACVLSFRTHRAHVDACVDDLAATIPRDA